MIDKLIYDSNANTLTISSREDFGSIMIGDSDTYQMTNITPLSTLQISQLTSINIDELLVQPQGLQPQYQQYSINSLKIIKYIIAGNFEEYNNYIKIKNLDDKEYVYLYDADMLTGKKNVHGFYVGTWRNREDITEIKGKIIECNMT